MFNVRRFRWFRGPWFRARSFALIIPFICIVTLFTNCGGMGFKAISASSGEGALGSIVDQGGEPAPDVPVTPTPPDGNSQPPTGTAQQGPPGNNNGIWMFYGDVTEENLRAMVKRNIFNIYLHMGFPNPKDDPELGRLGAVPDVEVGILHSKANVEAKLQLVRKVDDRLRLWAWFGTWSDIGYETVLRETGDRDQAFAAGFDWAKISVNTKEKRAAIIRNIVRVAGWGFYGVQDDVESLLPDSMDDGIFFNDHIVNYWNEEAIALHEIGVKHAPFTPAVWWRFNEYQVSKITEPDFHILVPDTVVSEQQWFDLANQFLEKSKIPVVFDLYSLDITCTVTKRIDKLQDWNNPVKLIIGYAIYDENHMNADWSCWDSWHK